MTGAIDNAESRRIALLRWPLILLVVFIHANNDRVGIFAPAEGAARWTHLVRQFISEGLAATAVPLFFLLAGRLYFRGPGLSVDAYTSKLRSRVRTLVVPFVLWNVLLAVAYAVALRIPALASFVSGAQSEALSGGPAKVLSAVLGVGRDPIAYQFWFIRDLIVTVVLLTPLLALLLRFAPWAGWLLLGLPWLLHAWPIEGFSVVAPLFFFVGGSFGWRERSPFPPARAALVLVPAWFVLLEVDHLGLTGAAYPYVRQVGIAVGIAAMLALATLVEARPALSARLAAASAFAFFLFAVHEPLLTLVQRVGQRALAPLTPLEDLAVYFAAVALVVAVATVAQALLARVAPRAFAVLTGGR